MFEKRTIESPGTTLITGFGGVVNSCGGVGVQFWLSGSGGWNIGIALATPLIDKKKDQHKKMIKSFFFMCIAWFNLIYLYQSSLKKWYKVSIKNSQNWINMIKKL